jgi:hypothetical protein
MVYPGLATHGQMLVSGHLHVYIEDLPLGLSRLVAAELLGSVHSGVWLREVHFVLSFPCFYRRRNNVRAYNDIIFSLKTMLTLKYQDACSFKTQLVPHHGTVCGRLILSSLVVLQSIVNTLCWTDSARREATSRYAG